MPGLFFWPQPRRAWERSAHKRAASEQWARMRTVWPMIAGYEPDEARMRRSAVLD
jgi:hypothetical protein